MDADITQKLGKVVPEMQILPPLPDIKTPIPPSEPSVPLPRGVTYASSRLISKHDLEDAQKAQEQCWLLCLSLFFREQAPVRSLGFTSSIGGEGKSLLAATTAEVLANASNSPVTLLECNWDRPSLHEFFGCLLRPGLAELLRGECSETHIRHQVSQNLTFIPAGAGRRDAMKSLQLIWPNRLLDILGSPDDLLIVDLPAIATTNYGSHAARLVESLVIVVGAGVTPESLVAATCAQLKNLPVHGVVLNKLESRIPRWIQRML